MKRLLDIRAVVVLGALVVLAGCNGLYNYNNPGGTTYTVAGTVSLSNLDSSSSAVVTATMMSYPYSASAGFTVPDGNGGQTASYSVGNLPSGTYTVTIVVTAGAHPTPAGSDELNGGGTVAEVPVVAGSGPYTCTMTVASVPVMADVTLNASMQ